MKILAVIGFVVIANVMINALWIKMGWRWNDFTNDLYEKEEAARYE